MSESRHEEQEPLAVIIGSAPGAISRCKVLAIVPPNGQRPLLCSYLNLVGPRLYPPLALLCSAQESLTTGCTHHQFISSLKAMASATGNNSNLRSCSSLPNLLVWLLNLFILILAAAALGPVFLLRPRPTPFGWALVSVHATTALSALAAVCAQLTHLCVPAHTGLALAALFGHALASLTTFLRHDHSLRLLGFLLVFLEEVLLLGMFLTQAMALVATCVVSRRWAREYDAAETEKAAMTRKRGRKMARVQAESAAAAEAGVKAVDEKVMRSSSGKKVHWANNDGFEEC